MVYLAVKTLEAIEGAIVADQGTSFRNLSGQVLPHIGDAYREDEFPFRSHMGASGIGQECARQIWYNFRWAHLHKFDGRMLRLFNRGHLEEGRFIAMLLMIGIAVYQQDENGNQYRISDAGGHFGGSGDGIGIGIPDLPEGTQALLEFKTSGEKVFLKLEKEGVRSCKFEHYVQMQVYMKKMGLTIALYVVVNKNTDHLYAELVPYDERIAEEFLQRGRQLIPRMDPPEKINQSPGWWKCKFCDFHPVCHKGVEPHRNCRTCKHSRPVDDGSWQCGQIDSPYYGRPITKEEQFVGSDQYERGF